mmetsp:Transcript_81916/g.132878  ORF Transcript_81916/g.132878 Transcript_81916/m.132878 type:complete len:207 (-) Transcript_81916:225-845(-)
MTSERAGSWCSVPKHWSSKCAFAATRSCARCRLSDTVFHMSPLSCATTCFRCPHHFATPPGEVGGDFSSEEESTSLRAAPPHSVKNLRLSAAARGALESDEALSSLPISFCFSSPPFASRAMPFHSASDATVFAGAANCIPCSLPHPWCISAENGCSLPDTACDNRCASPSSRPGTSTPGFPLESALPLAISRFASGGSPRPSPFL